MNLSRDLSPLDIAAAGAPAGHICVAHEDGEVSVQISGRDATRASEIMKNGVVGRSIEMEAR